MKSTQNLPQRLKELRNQHHYSQEQLAEILNVTRQAVSRWENGKAVPDIENILMMAELYNVPVDELFDEEYHNQEQSQCLDNLKEATDIIEKLVLSVIIVLSSNWYIIGIPVVVAIIIWLFITKRRYKSVFILCILGMGICVYDFFIFVIHYQTVYDTFFIIPR